MDIWDFLSKDQAKWAPRRSRPHVRWSLPSGKNPFKSHRFWAPRRPGVAPLRDPVPKILHFFWKVFRTRLFKTKICKITQEWLFLQRKKSAFKRSYTVRGMGPPPGTRFCMYSYHTKQNKKAKTKKKHASFVWGSYIKETFCVFTACAKMFIWYKNPKQNSCFF